MKVNIEFSLPSYRQIVDLEEYGHDRKTTWSELTEDEQNEIRDSLAEQMMIEVVGYNYD